MTSTSSTRTTRRTRLAALLCGTCCCPRLAFVVPITCVSVQRRAAPGGGCCVSPLFVYLVYSLSNDNDSESTTNAGVCVQARVSVVVLVALRV